MVNVPPDTTRPIAAPSEHYGESGDGTNAKSESAIPPAPAPAASAELAVLRSLAKPQADRESSDVAPRFRARTKPIGIRTLGMVALAAGGLGARAATNGGLIGLSANRHTGLPQCPVSSCAEVPAFWAGGVKSESAASHVTNDELPFCESTFVGVYEAAQRLFDEGMPALPYLLDDATNGLARPDGGRRFGFEVEFDFDSSVDRKQGLQMLDQIARLLHEANLTARPTVSEHAQAKANGYSDAPNAGLLEREPDPPIGRASLGEWVSPISSDEPAQWNRTRAVLDIVKRAPTETNERTAVHVHIGTPDYRNDLTAFMNLLHLSRKYEDVLYRLGGRPELKPSMVPSQITLVRSAESQDMQAAENRESRLRPLSYRKPNRIPDAPYHDVVEFLRDQTKNRRVALNFQGVRRKPGSKPENDHVEFRIPDATLKPEILQAHITLYLHMVDKAIKASQSGTSLTSSGAEPVGSHFDAAARETHTDRARFLTDTQSFRDMLDELFDRNIDKARMTALFAITGWQPPSEVVSAYRQRYLETRATAMRAVSAVQDNVGKYHLAAVLVAAAYLLKRGDANRQDAQITEVTEQGKEASNAQISNQEMSASRADTENQSSHG